MIIVVNFAAHGTRAVGLGRRLAVLFFLLLLLVAVGIGLLVVLRPLKAHEHIRSGRRGSLMLWLVLTVAMVGAIVDSQREDGDFSGSWDPVGAWGNVGGRVYSTALMTLCLEVYYRYGRVFGAK